MSRVTDRDNWLELWQDDKRVILSCMVANMHSDLKAGYNFFGNSIQKQLKEINEYQARYDREMDSFKTMEDHDVNRWCYYDLVKRGAIE